MIIAIEGMDGSGKTTIAKRLAKDKNFIYKDMPNKTFIGLNDDAYNKLCDKVYESNDKIMAWFFGLGNIIQATYNNGKDIILDRHLLSNYFWNGSEETEEIFSTLVKMAGKPDLTIVLYAGTKERLNRIRQRNEDDKDLYDPDKLIFGYDKMIEFAKAYDLPFFVINTEQYSIETTYKICNKLISKIENLSKQEIAEFCHKCNERIQTSNKPFSQYL